MDTKTDESVLQVKKKSHSSVKPILVTGRRKGHEITRVIADGKDLTPKPLNQNIFTAGKERQLSVYEVSLERHGKLSRSTSVSQIKTPSTVRFKADFDKLLTSEYTGSALGVSHGSVYTDLLLTPDISLATEDDNDRNTDSLTDTDVLEDDVAKMVEKKIPDHVRLILSETNTFFLLNIFSATAETGSEEG